MSLAKNVNLDLLNDLDNLEYNRKVVKVKQFVADWLENLIECYPRGNDWLIYNLRGYIEGTDNEEMRNWFDNDTDNINLGIKAILYGYEVEEEPKFYINLVSGDRSMGDWDRLIQSTWSGKLEVVSSGWELAERRDMFTKEEIMNIEERYWPFAVPVEEVNHEGSD